MVGFETTTSNYQKFKALPPAARRAKIIKWAIGGAAGVGVVVGVTLALTFGSIAATASNIPVHDALTAAADANFGDLMGGADCCDCGHCDGDCCAVC
jgi:hypothetical protein